MSRNRHPNPWVEIDRMLETLNHNDALSIMGFYHDLLAEGVQDGDRIPDETLTEFLSMPDGKKAKHLVIANSLEDTVTKRTIEGVDTIFQAGLDIAKAALTTDADYDFLREKLNDSDYDPAAHLANSTLLKDCTCWYRVRQLSMNSRHTPLKELRAVVKHEVETLMEDMKTFFMIIYTSSAASFVHYLKHENLRPIDATAVDLKIVKLHSLFGPVLSEISFDSEIVRMNDKKEARKEKEANTRFDPSYM